MTECRSDWTREEIRALFDLPFLDLLFEAQGVHRRFHAANQVQLSTLLSIKTGGCPEDCGYCSQSAFARSGLKAEKLMDVTAVLAAAAEAKAAGSGRFCMGAAWREPKDRDLEALCAMVAGVKAMGLETCMTLGMLSQDQADRLSAAGPRLLQPQYRHRAGELRQRHHHPHLPGAARHAGRSAASA
jgi:biotin synthase